jgi:NitT/TauT family transport system substrate-binding protein
MAEESGFEMMLLSQDIWLGMQGSVLAVKQDLLDSHPEIVEKLVRVTQEATGWTNGNPDEAAVIMARQLGGVGSDFLLAEVADFVSQLEVTPQVLLRSMERLEYTTDVEPGVVQGTIDYLVELGYIKQSFDAAEILDLRYLK